MSASPLSVSSRDDFLRLPQTYDNALYLLSLLSTNRDVTSLFEVPSSSADDLNALAIPEVVAWMARAGYANLTTDLAPLRCIHVAGTKGKGSVCAFATAILVEAAAADLATKAAVGRVGTYLSPHVVSVRERIWLDGQPIDRHIFAKYIFELWERLSEAAAAAAAGAATATDAAAASVGAESGETGPYSPHTKPFYFRFLTLLAFHVFLREGVRSAIIECGIGGEYDATNILPASSVTATAVTRLGIDHVAMLGHTLEKIAWNKAGIFKKGVAAFTLQGPLSQDSEVAAEKQPAPAPGEGAADRKAAQAMLRSRAHEKGAVALYEISPPAVVGWEGVPDAALRGSFQKYNMALAAAVARHHLYEVGVKNDGGDLLDPRSMPDCYRAALANATLRGRCETVYDLHTAKNSTGPVEYLVDGAHTADSLGEVACYFARKTTAAKLQPAALQRPPPPPRRILLFSVRDRRPGDLVRALVAGTSGNADTSSGRAHEDDLFDDALFVFPPDAESLRSEAVAAMCAVSPRTSVAVCDDVAAAIGRIQTLAGTAAQPFLVLAAGSFVLAREVLQELNADADE